MSVVLRMVMCARAGAAGCWADELKPQAIIRISAGNEKSFRNEFIGFVEAVLKFKVDVAVVRG